MELRRTINIFFPYQKFNMFVVINWLNKIAEKIFKFIKVIDRF